MHKIKNWGYEISTGERERAVRKALKGKAVSSKFVSVVPALQNPWET
jgi:hypothetical protein